RDGQRRGELAERPHARVNVVRPAAGPDAKSRSDDLCDREDASCFRGREPALTMEEEHEEAEDADLRPKDEAAADCEAPDPCVLQRVCGVAEFLLDRGRLPQPDE